MDRSSALPMCCNYNTEIDSSSLFTDDKSLVKLEIKEELEDQLAEEVNVQNNDSSYHIQGGKFVVAASLPVIIKSDTSYECYEGNADNATAVQCNRPDREDPAYSELIQSLPVIRGYTTHVTENAKKHTELCNFSADRVMAMVSSSTMSTSEKFAAQFAQASYGLDLYGKMKKYDNDRQKLLAESSSLLQFEMKEQVSSSCLLKVEMQCSEPDDDLVQAATITATTSIASCADTTSQSCSADETVDLYLGTKEANFMCKLCSKTYLDIEKCKDHIRSHLGLKPFACTQANCTKSFSSKDNLRSHVYLNHTSHDRFKCRMCDRTFNKRGRFMEHCNKHNSVMPYDCSYCGKAFPSKNSIFLHIFYVHNYGEKSHLCPECGKVFSTKRNLGSHLFTHGEKRFKCELCTSRFLSRRKLANHMASHSEERPFMCNVCLKTFNLEKTLKRHISSTHENKKNFKCTKCDKSFVSGNFLREHLLKHEGVRKYSCETCGKTFAQSSHLAAHKFSHGEKKFVCSVCGAKFNRNDNMKSHVKRHETKALFAKLIG